MKIAELLEPMLELLPQIDAKVGNVAADVATLNKQIEALLAGDLTPEQEAKAVQIKTLAEKIAGDLTALDALTPEPPA